MIKMECNDYNLNLIKAVHLYQMLIAVGAISII